MPCPGPFHFSHSVDYIYELCHHKGQNMPILDVPTNRHLEGIGQEIRVRHDFLPHFCLLPFLYIWFMFPGHNKCVYVQK